MDRLRDENKQLALTICELEESLDIATNKVKQYKADISALERTLAGEASNESSQMSDYTARIFV